MTWELIALDSTTGPVTSGSQDFSLHPLESTPLQLPDLDELVQSVFFSSSSSAQKPSFPHPANAFVHIHAKIKVSAGDHVSLAGVGRGGTCGNAQHNGPSLSGQSNQSGSSRNESDGSKDDSYSSDSHSIETKQEDGGIEDYSTTATGLRNASVQPKKPVIQLSVMQQAYCSLVKLALLPLQAISALVQDVSTMSCSLCLGKQPTSATAAILQASGLCSCQSLQASKDAKEGNVRKHEQAEALIKQLAVPNRQYMQGLSQVPHPDVVNALSSLPMTSEATMLFSEPKSKQIYGRPDISATDFRLLSWFAVEFAVRSNAVALCVALESNLTGRFSDNNFLVVPWESKIVAFMSDPILDAESLVHFEQTLSFLSLADSNIKL